MNVLLEFSNAFCSDFVVNDPLALCYFLAGGFLQISSVLEVILGYFSFTKFGGLEFSRIDRVQCD